MPQNTIKVYSNLQENDFYKFIQNKGINIDYIFSIDNNKEKPFLIRELIEKWIVDIKDTLRPSTYACYQNNIEKYLLPYIGEMPVCFFNANLLSKILAFIKQENSKKDNIEESFSQYTLYLLENIVRAVFHYGAKNGLIREVSFGKAEYKIKTKKEALPLSELEVDQLLCVIDKQELDIQLQILLPLYTGISLSELCGLKWEDIDLESGTIHIHCNVVRVQQKKDILKDNKHKKSVHEINNSVDRSINIKNTFFDNKTDKSIKSCENNGKIQPATILVECELPKNECRKFIMPERLQNILKIIIMNRKPEKKSYVAEIYKKTGRKKEVVVKKINIELNTNSNENIIYSPPDSRTLQYRLKNIGEISQIENLNCQRLRDTFAVMCLQAGGDVYSVSYVLGVGINAICDRYGHWIIKRYDFLREIE